MTRRPIIAVLTLLLFGAACASTPRPAPADVSEPQADNQQKTDEEIPAEVAAVREAFVENLRPLAVDAQSSFPDHEQLLAERVEAQQAFEAQHETALQATDRPDVAAELVLMRARSSLNFACLVFTDFPIPFDDGTPEYLQTRAELDQLGVQMLSAATRGFESVRAKGVQPYSDIASRLLRLERTAVDADPSAVCLRLTPWHSPEGLTEGALRSLPDVGEQRLKVIIDPKGVALDGEPGNDPVGDLMGSRSLLAPHLDEAIRARLGGTGTDHVFVEIDVDPLVPYGAVQDALYTVWHATRGRSTAVELRVGNQPGQSLARGFRHHDEVLLRSRRTVSLLQRTEGVSVARNSTKVEDDASTCPEGFPVCWDDSPEEVERRLKQIAERGADAAEALTSLNAAQNVEGLRSMILEQRGLQLNDQPFTGILNVYLARKLPAGLLTPLFEANCRGSSRSNLRECKRIFDTVGVGISPN